MEDIRTYGVWTCGVLLAILLLAAIVLFSVCLFDVSQLRVERPCLTVERRTAWSITSACSAVHFQPRSRPRAQPHPIR